MVYIYIVVVHIKCGLYIYIVVVHIKCGLYIYIVVVHIKSTRSAIKGLRWPITNPYPKELRVLVEQCFHSCYLSLPLHLLG